MKTIHKVTGYSMNWNPNGTLNGKARATVSLDVDGSRADAEVLQAVDGTEEAITGTLASHIAS